jgi:hypothetical protein
MRHISFVLAAAMAAAPLTGAFAAPPLPQTDRAFDRVAVADLRHARAGLAADHVAAAGNWAERAETELLNRASYDADGMLQPGTPITPDTAIHDVVTLRGDIDNAGHELRQARHEDSAAIRTVRGEMPSS